MLSTFTLFFLILFLFSNDDKQLPVATVRKFDFSPYLTFIRGQRTFSTLFNSSILRTHSSSRNRSLNVKLQRVLDFKSNTHPGFIKASLHYSQQSLFLAISTGGMVAFGSPWPDSLAEDCHLIIARRHWNLLKALTNVHEWKASCSLNNEWYETLMLSSSSIRQQCIQAKISKTLDKRSTLIFAANCTKQKLSSSESYYLTPNL